MINEIDLKKILLIENKSKLLFFKTFNSPLKKMINNIFNKYDFPNESLHISLFYLNNYYKCIKHDNIKINFLLNNINIFLFTSIILSIKHIYDESFNIRHMCNTLNIDYNKYLLFEIILLHGLNWETNFENNEYYCFKKYLEHHMDLFRIQD
jgi:hypothetical protein